MQVWLHCTAWTNTILCEGCFLEGLNSLASWHAQKVLFLIRVHPKLMFWGGFYYHTWTWSKGSNQAYKFNEKCMDILAKRPTWSQTHHKSMLPRTGCIQQDSAAAVQTGKNQREMETRRGHNGGKDHVEPSATSSRDAVLAGSVGGCFATGLETCHTSPTHALICG